ncbi:MAG: patatin [Haliea sp.]|nr:patatin [Haliea sp.]
MRKARKLRELERQMDSAGSYAEWREMALQHDELSGQQRWRQVDQTSQYDYAQIRLRLDRLRNLRARHDDQGLLFTLNEGIHGNMGGMGRSSLYRRAKFGTKHLIEQYIEEVDDALRYLAELPDSVIPVQDKLDFFYRANICFGRSALMLSGGGVLGFYHLGVVKTLLEQGLLPRVISGSSAGSLIAGVLGTHTDAELGDFLDPAKISFEARREATVFSRLLPGHHPQLDITDLENIINRLIPDMTFQEAYEKTGRQISVTVAPAEAHQRSRLLNAITSPNVYVRSAVMASCAVPGIFPPVMLMARNVHDEPQPYLPTRRWVDGSVADDLPAKRLSRLYSTNHYIVSMVNPVATPFLHGNRDSSPVAAALGTLGVGIGREVLNFYRGIVQKKGENWPRFNLLMNGIHSLLDQEYSGDINIVPSFRWYNPTRLLSHLTEKELVDLMEGGAHSCYPNVEAIRICTRISRTMEELLQRFEYGDLRPSAEEFYRPRSSRRRPTPTRTDREALREHQATASLGKPAASRRRNPPAGSRRSAGTAGKAARAKGATGKGAAAKGSAGKRAPRKAGAGSGKKNTDAGQRAA